MKSTNTVFVFHSFTLTVYAGAGAPSWVSLIDSIGAEVGFETDAQKNELKKLSITNQVLFVGYFANIFKNFSYSYFTCINVHTRL